MLPGGNVFHMVSHAGTWKLWGSVNYFHAEMKDAGNCMGYLLEMINGYWKTGGGTPSR